MAQMTDVLIAKIVLGYLTSQKLSKTIDSFLGESEFLNITNIDNNKERILNQLEDLNLLPSLEDILNDYFAYNQTSDVKSEKVYQLWKQLDIVLGQIRSLTLGRKKTNLFLERKRKVVNGYNNHIPRKDGHLTGHVTLKQDGPPLSHSDGTNVLSEHNANFFNKQLNDLCKTKKSPKRKSSCPKKRPQVDSVYSSQNVSKQQLVDPLQIEESAYKEVPDDVWQTAGKLAENINMIVGGDLNTLHQNNSDKDLFDINDFIKHITVEHDFSSLFAMIKDAPSVPLLDSYDQSENQKSNIFQDFKYLESLSSAEEKLSETLQKAEVSTETNDILLTKLNHSNVFDKQITNSGEKIESELNTLNGDNINNEEQYVAPDIVNDAENMFQNSSDFPRIEISTKKLESPIKSGLSNTVQSAFEITNELNQLVEQTKQYTDNSFFFTSESFMHFLTDGNSMDSTNVESSQHIRNLNSELNSILDTHIQVPEKLPHSNLSLSNVELAQPLSSFTNVSEMKSFQKIYKPQESYLNLSKNEMKLSTIQTLPDYSSSIDFSNHLLKDNLSVPKDAISSNSWVDESVSIASDALLLLATSPIKKTPDIFSNSQIPGFLHPPVEISSLLKSFISNDSLHQSNFNSLEVQTNGSESEKNEDKIEHTSQLPSYSPTRTQGNINSVDNKPHLFMVQDLNIGDQLPFKKNGHRSKAKSRPTRPKVVPCDYNFVSKQANKAKHKTKSNKFDSKLKELNFATSVSNLLSSEKATLVCTSSSTPADTITVAPLKSYDNGDNTFSNDGNIFLRSCPSDEYNGSDEKTLICTNNTDPNRSKQNCMSEFSKIIKISQEIPIITLKKENMNVSKNNTTVNVTPEKVTYNDKKSSFTVYDPPKGLSSSKDTFADRFKKIQAKHLAVKQNVVSSASNSKDLDTHITNKSEANKLLFDKSPSQSYVVSTIKSPSPALERNLLTSPIQACMYRIQGNTISPLHPSSNEPGYFSEGNVCDIESFVSISPIIPYQPSNRIRPAHKPESSRRNQKMSSDEKLVPQNFTNNSLINIDTTPKKNHLTSLQSPEQNSIRKEIKVRFNFKSPKKIKVEKRPSQSKAKFKQNNKTAPSSDLTNPLFLRKKMLFNTAAKNDTKLYNQVVDFYDCSKKSTKLLQVSRSVQIESPDLSFSVDPAFQDMVASCNDQLEIILEPLKSFLLSSNMPSCTDQPSIPIKENICKLSNLVLKTANESSYNEENSKNTANIVVVSNGQSSTLSETIVVSSEQSTICSTLIVSNEQSNFLCDESAVVNEQSETITCLTEQLDLATGEIKVPVEQLNTVYKTTMLEKVAHVSANENNSKLVNLLENTESINTKPVIQNIESVRANTESEITFKAPNFNEKTAKRPFLSDVVDESVPKKQKKDEKVKKKKKNDKRKNGLAALKSIDLELFLSKIDYSS